MTRRSIQINKGVVRVAGERRIDTPKNRRGRVVHYPPHLDEMVRRHLDVYAEPGRTGKLFPSGTGGYLSQSTLNGKPNRVRMIKGRIVNESATAFRKACDTAGRPDLRLHDLRHTGAVLAVATGEGCCCDPSRQVELPAGFLNDPDLSRGRLASYFTLI